MSEDRMKLQGHLTAQVRYLWQLDVVEQAEEFIRDQYALLLVKQTLQTQQEAHDMRHHLRMLRSDDRLAHLLIAEEHERDLRKRIAALERRSAEHDYASRQARRLYTAHRACLTHTIARLQLLLRRTGRTAPLR